MQIKITRTASLLEHPSFQKLAFQLKYGVSSYNKPNIKQQGYLNYIPLEQIAHNILTHKQLIKEITVSPSDDTEESSPTNSCYKCARGDPDEMK